MPRPYTVALPEVFPYCSLLSEADTVQYVSELLAAKTSFAVTMDDDRFVTVWLSKASYEALARIGKL